MELFLQIILFAPLAAALFDYIFRKGWAWPHITGAGLSFAAAVLFFANTSTARVTILEFGGLADAPFVLRADYRVSLLAMVVALVALAIFIYARGYMHGQKGKSWFWPAISLFLAAMQLLVLAGDWFLFITGWEIMGLASFLLIGTWHEREAARTGSVKAFLLTRFTDIGLYAGVFIVILTFGDLMIPFAGGEKISLLASLLLLLAVMGKSAQVPFQSWLSSAMAGPTPVSALLHSATMVGAGMLLLLKIYPILPGQALTYLAAVGSITIILTGVTAITAKDVKQMLAASTSSQLGFMLLALGTGYPGAALAHWLAHAFMKSSLFLGAGVFQEGYESTLYEKIKGSGKHLKFTFIAFAVAGVALSGIPPLIGFWSKDAILAASFKSETIFFALSGSFGALFTAIYIAKALGILWRGQAEKVQVPEKKWMYAGISVLLLMVLGGGFALEHVITSMGYEFPSDLPSQITGLSLAGIGLVTGWFYKESWLPGSLVRVTNSNYAISGGYKKVIAAPVLKLADLFYKVDRAILAFIEGTGDGILATSAGASQLDRSGKKGVLGIGNATLWLSVAIRDFDKYIIGWVEHLAEGVRQLGGHGKKWQSGLVHKELAITVVTLLILILILTVSIIQL